MSDLDFSRFIVLMAYQRSGTHMLGSAIASHPQLRYADEIFRNNPPQALETAIETIRQYDHPDLVTCLDIKYNQIGASLSLLEQMRVIHLVRRDDVAHWFSGLWKSYAKRNPNAAQAVERGEYPAIPFDRAGFEKFAARKARYVAKFSCLEGVRLYYEDLTGNCQIAVLPEQAEIAICNLAGVERWPLSIALRKDAPTNYRDCLEGE